jgi:hypothetical protein
MRKLLIVMIIGLFLLFTFSAVSAEDTISRVDVEIEAMEDESLIIPFTSKGDKVNVNVESDIPIDVHIVASEDYSYIGHDYSDAKVSKTGVTSTDFSYTIPDSQSYYLVMYNPNNATATVDYEYTDLFAEEFEEATEEAAFWLGMGILLCVAVIVIIIVVIVVIIVLLTRKKEKPPQYPQQGYVPPPGQQPPPPPPQY